MSLLVLILLFPAPPEPEPSTFGSGYLGVQFSEEGGGVVVQKLMPNTPASRSPLREGDRILTIDDREIPNMTVSRATIQSLRPGSPYEIAVKRGNETIRFRIRPAVRPE